MKKFFLLMMAVGAMTLVSCNNTGNGDKASGSAAPSGEEQVAEAQGGNTFEGANFTMEVPELLSKEGFKNDKTINASNEDNSVKMDATFSDTPCKPEDFTKYADNLKVMKKEYTAEDPKIDGNYMTVKYVKGEEAETDFVAFLDETGGVAGSFKYPVAKAAEVEALIMPMLKSIKKK